jgi:hypothetical protein
VLALRKLVYLVMVTAVFSAPLAACTLPGFALSEQEKECCHHMANHCGGSQMETSHSCCTKTPPLTAGTLQPTIKFSPLPAATLSDFTPGAELPHIGNFCAAAANVHNDSKSPPGQLTVLRI